MGENMRDTKPGPEECCDAETYLVGATHESGSGPEGRVEDAQTQSIRTDHWREDEAEPGDKTRETKIVRLALSPLSPRLALSPPPPKKRGGGLISSLPARGPSPYPPPLGRQAPTAAQGSGVGGAGGWRGLEGGRPCQGVPVPPLPPPFPQSQSPGCPAVPRASRVALPPHSSDSGPLRPPRASSGPGALPAPTPPTPAPSAAPLPVLALSRVRVPVGGSRRGGGPGGGGV
ncbi:hypothetical protein [Murine herpesvirus strain 4556]|uniref:Basic proline-rich protein-like n=2 Tax=Orthoherpesviridae TaxID=3044472 RepID=O41979_MHV68|nr:unknown [Murid gammaherpesvirus 4]AXP99184.1 unknown protein [synthetic construct]QJQ80268.1 hypothetical protein [Murine herpesvirus]UNZ86709.1 hypothetical protein [Murine herpesvirus strain 72]UNZ86786.1 hypothetical protein [Murine herpesvirus strain 4556]AAB66425.1 unknown [Murid gammaherpesvirus 4]